MSSSLLIARNLKFLQWKCLCFPQSSHTMIATFWSRWRQRKRKASLVPCITLCTELRPWRVAFQKCSLENTDKYVNLPHTHTDQPLQTLVLRNKCRPLHRNAYTQPQTFVWSSSRTVCSKVLLYSGEPHHKKWFISHCTLRKPPVWLLACSRSLLPVDQKQGETFTIGLNAMVPTFYGTLL